jgi:membrane associated rhomboid family serine protease
MESIDDDSLYFDNGKACSVSDSFQSWYNHSPSRRIATAAAGNRSARRAGEEEEQHSGGRDRSMDESSQYHRPSTYSMKELIRTLGSQETASLSPELQRRVLDFRLAQQKRKDKYGPQSRYGFFGMYLHLTDVRVDLEWAEDAAWRRLHGQPYLAWADFNQARMQASQPWFTYATVFMCSVMMIVVFVLNGFSIEPLKRNPMLGPSGETLIRAGARDTELITTKNQWYRIFTPMVLHAGLIHYLINMLALWFVGRSVEQAHGSVNAMVLFLVPGVGGNILSAIFLPQYVSVGASGGIFGLIGGCLADLWLNWSLLFIKSADEDYGKSSWKRNCCAVTFLFVEIMINVVRVMPRAANIFWLSNACFPSEQLLGLVTPYIDNWAHLGGLVYGICCGFSTIEPLNVRFLGVSSNTWEKVRLVTVRFTGLFMVSLRFLRAFSILSRGKVVVLRRLRFW